MLITCLNINKKRIFSEEHKKKLSEAAKGRKHSEKTLKKMSESHKGHILSEEGKKKVSESKKGNKNPMWKENITYYSLHEWIRNNLPKSKLCQLCKLVPPYDCVNITGIYNRDFKNWLRGCRKCHMISDGRLDNLHERKKKRINIL
ncbi:MAG: hypothetical protein K0S93_88 [Nitrososphaeraceae archaeon]|jgi:hypothetical protein|nr:hypothetical protein [Nitrososphaeraceae archaeon]